MFKLQSRGHPYMLYSEENPKLSTHFLFVLRPSVTFYRHSHISIARTHAHIHTICTPGTYPPPPGTFVPSGPERNPLSFFQPSEHPQPYVTPFICLVTSSLFSMMFPSAVLEDMSYCSFYIVASSANPNKSVLHRFACSMSCSMFSFHTKVACIARYGARKVGYDYDKALFGPCCFLHCLLEARSVSQAANPAACFRVCSL